MSMDLNLEIEIFVTISNMFYAWKMFREIDLKYVNLPEHQEFNLA